MDTHNAGIAFAALLLLVVVCIECAVRQFYGAGVTQVPFETIIGKDNGGTPALALIVAQLYLQAVGCFAVTVGHDHNALRCGEDMHRCIGHIGHKQFRLREGSATIGALAQIQAAVIGCTQIHQNGVLIHENITGLVVAIAANGGYCGPVLAVCAGDHTHALIEGASGTVIAHIADIAQIAIGHNLDTMGCEDVDLLGSRPVLALVLTNSDQAAGILGILCIRHGLALSDPICIAGLQVIITAMGKPSNNDLTLPIDNTCIAVVQNGVRNDEGFTPCVAAIFGNKANHSAVGVNVFLTLRCHRQQLAATDFRDGRPCIVVHIAVCLIQRLFCDQEVGCLLDELIGFVIDGDGVIAVTEVLIVAVGQS